MLLLAGCTASGQPSTGEVAAQDLPVTQVTRGDISSTVVLHGAVTSAPEVAVPTPIEGDIHQSAAPGDTVSAGQQIGSVGDTAITATAAGTLSMWTTGDGVSVGAGITAAVISTTQLAVSVTVPVEDAFRMYSVPTQGRASVESGPGGLTCTLATPIDLDAEDTATVSTGVDFVCLLDPDVSTMPGLPASVGVRTASADGTLLLPVEAVDGSSSTGTVTRVLDDGQLQETQVSLGITDGVQIEVLDGLAEGDRVLGVVPLG